MKRAASMPAASAVALAFALAVAPDARAQTATSTSAPVLVPPEPLGALMIAYPEGAPRSESPIEVTVRIRVDDAGEVERVELVRGVGAPFDEAVLEGAAAFRFAPARYGGVPVTVDINFTQRFVAPPVGTSTNAAVATASAAERLDAVLAGKLEERGTRHPLRYASVIATVGTRDLETTSDEAGVFSLPLASGTATITVTSAGHRRFKQLERLAPGEKLEVHYLIEPESFNPYEVVVIGKLDRTEVARTTLRGRDIQQVPGTFGDPFRVIGALPGVSSIMSLLPFPVVRGSSPGNTGFLIDGVRVPLLFHLLAGPSVIHPEFIDAIEFSPGGFPAEYGGYTGGIVDGKTRPARADETKIDLDLNFFQVGGFFRHPVSFLDGTGTIAARYGYPGVVVGLADPRTSLSYYDYQGRFDGGSKSAGYTLFLFGGNDSLDQVPVGQPNTAPKEPVLHLQFHRADLRFIHQSDRFTGNYQVTFGYDSSTTPNTTLESFNVTPRLRWAWNLAPEIELRFGLDGLARRADYTTSMDGAGQLGLLLGMNGEPSKWLYAGGVLVETILRPVDRLVIRPGMRADGYDDTKNRQGAIDPRLLARYRILDEGPELWLKGSVGIYHQPPRFTIPVPGLDEIAFQKGLLESEQAMIGADVLFPDDWSLDVQAYYNWMDPILYDTSLNPSVAEVTTQAPTAPPGQVPPDPPKLNRDIDERINELLRPATGRSYGLELLLRHQSRNGLSGWIAYTLSRSERLRDGDWVGFDFDRTHILNVVASMPFPRRWQIGVRAQVQAGRPLTTTMGLATARTAAFVRFDLRVDKTAIWNDWLLDFYIDITNVVLGAEELQPDVPDVRYVLPTIGFRAIF